MCEERQRGNESNIICMPKTEKNIKQWRVGNVKIALKPDPLLGCTSAFYCRARAFKKKQA